MGCCESIPDAPKEVLPDPGEDESCTFAIGAVGVLSPDYIAYKGSEVDVQDAKWFYINKEGTFFSGDCTIFLENFKRGLNPEKPKKGEDLWTVKFDSSPSFDRHYKSPESLQWDGWLSGWGDFDGTLEEDDYYYGQYHGGRSPDYRRIMNWTMKTHAMISPGTRSGTPIKLEVFARGTAICYYDQFPNDDAELEWVQDTTEFVDRICYRVLRGEEQIAGWAVDGERQGQGDFTTKCELFDMTMKGGWMGPIPIIQTSSSFDPTLSLIIGYMCAFEFSPSGVKVDLDCQFPKDPYQWGLGGW
eukprot:TRINITY_DN70715_c0_g1_i1.p1 TRINITY_DN70715_c0_g1~~TRINITY_DN70715_c0_g1_i1.p1  ORF type:complete len:301 (-),score=53.68 TRINITY_DN70715_c0_g1_i1:87-989(-)